MEQCQMSEVEQNEIDADQHEAFEAETAIKV